MIKYPNGQKYQPSLEKKRQPRKSKEDISLSASNRGMNLEEDINLSNEWYKEQGIALITKRPTPINVVKVDYSSKSPKSSNKSMLSRPAVLVSSSNSSLTSSFSSCFFSVLSMTSSKSRSISSKLCSASTVGRF